MIIMMRNLFHHRELRVILYRYAHQNSPSGNRVCPNFVYRLLLLGLLPAWLRHPVRSTASSVRGSCGMSQKRVSWAPDLGISASKPILRKRFVGFIKSPPQHIQQSLIDLTLANDWANGNVSPTEIIFGTATFFDSRGNGGLAKKKSHASTNDMLEQRSGSECTARRPQQEHPTPDTVSKSVHLDTRLPAPFPLSQQHSTAMSAAERAGQMVSSLALLLPPAAPTTQNMPNGTTAKHGARKMLAHSAKLRRASTNASPSAARKMLNLAYILEVTSDKQVHCTAGAHKQVHCTTGAPDALPNKSRPLLSTVLQSLLHILRCDASFDSFSLVHAS